VNRLKHEKKAGKNCGYDSDGVNDAPGLKNSRL